MGNLGIGAAIAQMAGVYIVVGAILVTALVAIVGRGRK
jgi:hypothetical protein